MAAGVKFQNWPLALGKGLHDLDTDTLKIALTNTTPTASTDVNFADITELSAGNGYSAGGVTLGSVSFTQSGGVATLDFADFSWTASGGDIGPYRALVLYNDSISAEELICYWDLGASESIVDGNSKTFNIASTGLLTIS